MLRLENLTKRYGEITALDGCSFEVPRGHMVGFLGPNGAGKTTTMRAIFGLVALDAGTVTWEGHPVTRADRVAFGYMPEERGLYPRMKARDHLAYIARLHGMDKRPALEAADRWLGLLGLSGRAGDAIEQLSHGNQQRVQLAAALVHEPELLVLDEPFAGLDPIGAETMAGVLRRQARSGAAVMFSSHQLDVVEDLCEDVAIIDEGRVVLAGDVRALKAAAPFRRLEIEVRDGGEDIVEHLDGVIEATRRNGRVVAVVDKTVDVTAALAAARSRGDVEHFAFTTPSLSDLFKEAVS